MVERYAGLFLNITKLLDQLEILGKPPYLPSDLTQEEQDRFTEKSLTSLRTGMMACEILNLKMSKLYLSDAIKDWEVRGLIYLASTCRIAELSKLLRKELDLAKFFHVPDLKLDYYDAKALFGIEVKDRFPSTTYDIKEAGNCYALSRNTACVFHLMRVLEIGLTALGAVFSISLKHTNWAPAIEQIESKVREMHKDPTWKVMPDCKEQQEFYSQAAGHFGILKDGWRNYTAHARGKYDEQEASDILTGVRAFMQKLATRLHE